MATERFAIESLDLKARGLARRDGKAIFVEGALPGELVEASTIKKKKNYEIAQTQQVLQASTMRVEPKCPYFGLCGGCAMQHLDPAAQVAIKQRTLEDNFWHIGRIKIPQILPPIYGPTWRYRYRARLSVRYVQRKGTVLIGFHERKSSFVADMLECKILPKRVSDLLPRLRELFMQMSVRERIPQLEVAVGDDVVVLLIRHLEPLTEEDVRLLRAYADEHKGVSWWTQSKGLDTIKPLEDSEENVLFYDLPQFDLRMPFKPADFTQVNPYINRSMIAKAMSLLDPQEDERVADLFCGLGNFSLPLARLCKEVVGVEGSSTLTDRALGTARDHGLDHKTSFSTLNLFEIDAEWLRGLGYFDKILIDPPREGALAVAQALSALEHSEKPKRIVYVSCNPATLARDAAVLTHTGNFRVLCAGVINMFPHTAHVESMAVLEPVEGALMKSKS